MLTAAQCETVAYMIDGGFVCRDCARQEVGEIALARIDAGLDERDDLRPVIAYSLGEHVSETYLDGLEPWEVYNLGFRNGEAGEEPGVDCDHCNERLTA